MCDHSNTEDLERIIREQREIIDKLIDAQKASLEATAESKKDKIESTLKTMVAPLMNPEVQKHFVKAGMELISGIEELVRSAPLPDSVRGNVDKACDAKDALMRDVVCEMNPVCKYKTGKKMKKIDVE